MRRTTALALTIGLAAARASSAQTPPRHPAAPATAPPRPVARPSPPPPTHTPAHPVASHPPTHPGVVAAASPRAPTPATPPAATPAPTPREEARAPRRRDPCEETLRAVEFEDHSRADDAWRRCRATLAPPGTIPSADALNRLELVASALQSLRRTDGAFCVAPSAPFDLDAWLSGVTDVRSCLVSLDRFLSSESELRRWMLTEPYAVGRLTSHAGVEVDPAHPTWPSGVRVEPESVAIARLAGRRYMRVCRCLPGEQPETESAVRAMHLPTAVERVLLAGIAERRSPAR